MTAESSRTIKQKSLFVIRCVAAFLLTASVAASISYLFRRSSTTLTEGYDFNEGVDENNPAEGPKVGERIDLTFFEGQDGTTLKDYIGDRPAVVALIDPKCDAVRGSTDQLHNVRDRLARVGVKYGLIAFTSSRDAEKFFDYANSLSLNDPSFQWRRSGRPAPTSFMMMVRPSHLLISPEGIVLYKWPGSNPKQQTRQRMANQIVSDTLKALGISSS